MDVKMEKKYQMAIEYDDVLEKKHLCNLKIWILQMKWFRLANFIKNNQIMGNL